MSAAIYNTIAVEVEGNGEAHLYTLRASGSSIKFAGYLVVYEETKGEYEKDENGDAINIPNDIAEGQKQHLLQLLPKQHFTQPPPRFSEASLVKLLEENGIGRPSTYAPTISTLVNRGYVYREKRRLHPTETGVIVTDLLTDHFPDIVDVSFTAKMEEDLDRIAEGRIPWVQTLSEFYPAFATQVKKAEKEMPEVKAEPEYIDRACPSCDTGQLMIRQGRYGKFISCDNFPECRYTEPWLEKIGVKCPDCSEGEIVERRSRKGRIFYGCSRYPECEFTSWKKPIDTPCPDCGGLLVLASRSSAQCVVCSQRFPLDQVASKSKEAT
jgi:DNA topoisomerase-1